MLTSRSWLLAVSVCMACGSSFSATDPGKGGSSDVDPTGGDTSAAGDPSGGAVTSGGSSGKASGGSSGKASGGSAGASAGSGGSNAGAGGSRAGAGGSTAGAGGSTAGAGGAPPPDCGKLQTEYLAALEKARVCDKGSTEQCTTSSTLPNACNCQVLVNAKSEATMLAKKAQKAMSDANCQYVTCGIACLPVITAACTANTMGSANNYVCSSMGAMATP